MDHTARPFFSNSEWLHVLGTHEVKLGQQGCLLELWRLASYKKRREAIMEHSTEVNTDATGVVIRGYDPVAYFTEGRPVPGRPDLSVEYQGGKYLFATAANRDAFNANPEKYVPQYGGYCAYGVAKGKKFDIDPSSWRIVDGKNYFLLNPAILKEWSAKAKEYLHKSEENWPRISSKTPSEL
jgi:YHS domain-containing protein